MNLILLEKSVSELLNVMQENQISAYRSDLTLHLKKIKENPSNIDSIKAIDKLCMHPRLLQDIGMESISQQKWMELILNILDALDAKEKNDK